MCPRVERFDIGQGPGQFDFTLIKPLRIASAARISPTPIAENITMNAQNVLGAHWPALVEKQRSWRGGKIDEIGEQDTTRCRQTENAIIARTGDERGHRKRQNNNISAPFLRVADARLAMDGFKLARSVWVSSSARSSLNALNSAQENVIGVRYTKETKITKGRSGHLGNRWAQVSSLTPQRFTGWRLASAFFNPSSASSEDG